MWTKQGVTAAQREAVPTPHHRRNHDITSHSMSVLISIVLILDEPL
jgi:hypothetical protein